MTERNGRQPAEFSLQKVRIYPVTRIGGRGDIEVIYTPHQQVAEARFRALEARRFELAVLGLPAVRAPQVMARICGTCGPFHQLASCMAIEAATGSETPPPATWLRELLCWLLLVSSHAATMAFAALPDFALPMSDAAVKNVTGLYMVDQDSVQRLSEAMRSVNDALHLLGGNPMRPAVIVPGGVACLPEASQLEKARALIAGCEDGLRETVRFVEMLTRRESMVFEDTDRLQGHYLASSRAGNATLIAEEVTAGSFDGGEEVVMDTEGFGASVEERPVEWSHLVPLAVKGFEPALVGPLARLNVGIGEDAPLARLEQERALEQWGHPLASEHLFLMSLAIEALWGWERAVTLLAEGAPAGKPCAALQQGPGDGFAVLDSPRGLLGHHLKLDGAGRVSSYRVMSPLQFNYQLLNSHLTGVARNTVRGLDISPGAAARLQLVVRSFNPCVPCGSH